jgi:hypothetical protein
MSILLNKQKFTQLNSHLRKWQDIDEEIINLSIPTFYPCPAISLDKEHLGICFSIP